MVVDIEGDEEEEEEIAAVETLLELPLLAAADEVDVTGVVVGAGELLLLAVLVVNPPNVVCKIVVCRIVVVTGCGHTAAMPFPAKILCDCPGCEPDRDASKRRPRIPSRDARDCDAMGEPLRRIEG